MFHGSCGWDCLTRQARTRDVKQRPLGLSLGVSRSLVVSLKLDIFLGLGVFLRLGVLLGLSVFLDLGFLDGLGVYLGLVFLAVYNDPFFTPGP